MKKQIIQTFFLLAIFLIVPTFALAAPAITSAVPVTTFSHNAVVNVTGTGFGTKNPVAPAVWDNGTAYSGLTNGSCIPTPAGFSVGQCTLNNGVNPYGWPDTNSYKNVYYKTTNPRGAWPVHYSNQWATDYGSEIAMDGLVVNGVTTTKQLYLSFWVYLDSGAGSPNAQNKWYRLLSGPWGSSGNGTLIWKPGGDATTYSFDDGYLGINWPGSGVDSTNTWSRLDTFVDSNVANAPQYTLTANNSVLGTYNSSPSQSWIINTLGGLGADFDNDATPTWNISNVVNNGTHVVITTPTPNSYETGDKVTISGVVGPTGVNGTWIITVIDNYNFYLDDYLATLPAYVSGGVITFDDPVVDWGEIYADDTQARVEICNASTFSNSNHCEIQIPQTTWADNGQTNGATLQIKVNQGSFPDGSSQYLYVVDASGTPNAVGKQITFGSGGVSDTVAPSAPSGLSVL